MDQPDVGFFHFCLPLTFLVKRGILTPVSFNKDFYILHLLVNLDVTNEIEKDELKKFVSYTKRSS